MFEAQHQPQLASLSLTHVYYDPNHFLGLPAAFLALVPQALVIVYVATICARRDFEVCYAFLGQLACEALNFVLKRTIKQNRPQRIMELGKGYGMPSSHSQFMGFFAIYTILYLSKRGVKKHFLWHCSKGATIIVVSAAVCVSRIFLAYHTSLQVLVGSSIGVIFGAAWFWLFSMLKIHGVVDWILDLRISRYFWLKDTVLDDALEQEWLIWTKSRQIRVKSA